MNLKLLLDFNPPTTTIIIIFFFFTTTTPPYTYALIKFYFAFERKWKSFVVIMPAFRGWETAASSALLKQDDEDIHFIIKFYSSSFSRCSLNEIIQTFMQRRESFSWYASMTLCIPFKTIPFLHRAGFFFFTLLYVKKLPHDFFLAIKIELSLSNIWS